MKIEETELVLASIEKIATKFNWVPSRKLLANPNHTYGVTNLNDYREQITGGLKGLFGNGEIYLKYSIQHKSGWMISYTFAGVEKMTKIWFTVDLPDNKKGYQWYFKNCLYLFANFNYAFQ